MLATTTSAQTKAIHAADEKISTMGGAVITATRPLFQAIVKLDDRLRVALLKIEQLEAELAARKDNER